MDDEKIYPTFFDTVTQSQQWEAWQVEQARRLHDFNKKYPKMGLKAKGIYDMSEVMECGWISQSHFQDFLEFTALSTMSKDVI